MACPAIDQGVYISTTGATFKIYCHHDWPYNDIKLISSPSLIKCIEQCAAWNNAGSPPCVGVAWIALISEPNGRLEPNDGCYLKKQMVGPGGSYWPFEVDAAQLQSNSLSTAPATPSIIFPSTPLSTSLISSSTSAGSVTSTKVVSSTHAFPTQSLTVSPVQELLMTADNNHGDYDRFQ